MMIFKEKILALMVSGKLGNTKYGLEHNPEINP
jgi:hypothetical protein